MSQAKARRFTRREYERMAAQGIFGPSERVELVAGEILVMTPQGSRHTTVVNLVADALKETFRGGFVVRVQQPLIVDPDSEPEPDVAVVTGSHDDYLAEHPKTALLVVEVAESSLRIDRRKARIYARAGIQEYWVANLIDGVLEVHRQPIQSAKGAWSYTEVTSVKRTGTVQPLSVPKVKLRVSDLLR